MKASKNKLDFEREFKPSNIPFGNIVNNNADFRNELFLQYCNAEAKPSFHLYLDDFYSEDEINKGFEEANNQIPISTSKVDVAASFIFQTPFESRVKELHLELINKASRKELPLKYYCNDIEKTAIVKTLRVIDKELDILKESVFDEKTDKYREAEIRANIVVELLGNLKELAPYIIDYLKQNNDNLLLHFKKANKLNFNLWQTVKSNFNNSISKALPPKQTEKEALPPQPIAKQRETLSDLITHQNSVEIVESVKIQYKNIRGKRLRILLMAFQELELLQKKRIAAKFHASCKNDFDWKIASYNAMNEKYFKIGYENKKGDYIESEDEKELKQMISYIEPLTKTD